MRLLRAWLPSLFVPLLAAPLWASSGCGNKPSQPLGLAAAEPLPASYPLEPLLVGLRREGIPVAQLQRLGDLPYYELELQLQPAPAGDRFEGHGTVTYRNLTGRPLGVLPLLLHPNATRELGGSTASALLELSEARSLTGPAVILRRKRLTLVELRFARPLRPGERLRLALRFSGKLRQLPPDANDVFGQTLSALGMSASGAGASDYGLLASGDGLLTLASAYPMLAPFRRGSFDVDPPTRFGDLAYNELANYKVRIEAPAGYVVVTNLHDLPAEAPRNGRVGHLAVGAANRDLVLVAGPQLQQSTAQVGTVRVTSVSAARDALAGGRALETARAALAFYEGEFGPYPYAELDVAEATLVGGAGGVEFPGMIVIAGMLYRSPSTSTNPLSQLLQLATGLGQLLGGGQQAASLPQLDRILEDMLTFTVAHEVAHQYFAGLIGSDCRHDPAFDEPLAQFAAGLYLEHARGAAEAKRLMSASVKLNYAVYRLLGGKDLAADQPVQRFPNALAYAAIVYGKAPYFYVALRQMLGAARLRQAMRQAVDVNRFQLINLSRWLESLERAAGGPAAGVRRLARRWFHELHGDEDLRVDDSGDAVLAELFGAELHEQLKQSFQALGMRPADLLRQLMGKMAGPR